MREGVTSNSKGSSFQDSLLNQRGHPGGEGLGIILCYIDLDLDVQ
jgi:hypothetical protein